MTMSTMYATKRILMWVLWGTTLLIAPSAQAHASDKEMHAFKTHVQPRIDGVLDDECWQIATPSAGFILIDPYEGVAATNQTFIRILYDADYLYIGLDMIDEEPSNIEGRMVDRDGRFAPLDLVGLVLDTYHDHQNAYGFYINAYGIQKIFACKTTGLVAGAALTRTGTASGRPRPTSTTTAGVPSLLSLSRPCGSLNPNNTRGV